MQLNLKYVHYLIMTLKEAVFLSVQKILPQALLSRCAGKLADCEWPMLKNFLIRFAVKKFKINLEEAIYSDPSAYKSFNDFFTRNLKPGIRPLENNENIIISPCDGQLTQSGQISNATLIQAKGKHFSVEVLLAENAPPHNYSDFAVIYLSPKDYHRVHMPMDGKLKKMVYVPGRLFSVNRVTASHIEGLFTKNERVICYFDTHIGEIAIIFVGAMLVAGISTAWHKHVAPNRLKSIECWDYTRCNFQYKKGEEIGFFNFGSTVICLFPNNVIACNTSGVDIKMGQRLAVRKAQ